MNRIQFNTGRQYTAEGQRIVAIIADGFLYFNDIDRGISGQFEIPEWDEWYKLDERQVMATYDSGCYQYIENVEVFDNGQMLKIKDILVWDWVAPVTDPIKEYVKKNARIDAGQLYIPGYGWVGDSCSDLEWNTAAMVLASVDIASQSAFMVETGEIDKVSLDVTLNIIKLIKERF